MKNNLIILKEYLAKADYGRLNRYQALLIGPVLLRLKNETATVKGILLFGKTRTGRQISGH